MDKTPGIRRVLIVSPSFPPINAPDMQRVRMSLPHYHDSRWQPVVLAVDPASHGGVREEHLLKTVPDNVQVHHVKAFSLVLTRWFGLRDIGWRSWWPLLISGAKIIRQQKIDLVFFSNTQFATFTLGRIWKRWLGIPYVIDLQDPWLTDYYTGPRRAERPGGWKYDVARLQARLLEGWTLRRMSALMSVSPNYIEDLRQRYPWFARIPNQVISFGASESDLAMARTLPANPPVPNLVRILSTGAAGPIMQPALRILFDGLASFEPRPQADALRLEFVGTSYASGNSARLSVQPVAREAGVEELVIENPLRLGMLEAMRAQIDAQALLLLGSMDPAYSASRLYTYFSTGRPVLAIVLKGSVLEKHLSELSFATIVSFDGKGPSAETRSQIQYFLQDALAGFPSGFAAGRNTTLFQREHLAPALTARQCALFNIACAFENS